MLSAAAELPHQLDLFLGPEAGAEVALGLVGVTEVIEESVKDVVQVLEGRRVKPHFPLPRGVGQLSAPALCRVRSTP
jgi:hypothetical protein